MAGVLGFVAAAAGTALTCGTGTLAAATPVPPPPDGRRHIEFLTPHPPYPLQARASHIEGEVTVRITWAAEGNVKKVVVVKSSGSRLLDEPTTNYIKARWRSLAGTEVTHTVPEQYHLR